MMPVRKPLVGSCLDYAPVGSDMAVLWGWMQQCPSCGYCAHDLSYMPPQLSLEILPKLVYSPAYSHALNEMELPPAVRRLQAWMSVASDFAMYAEAGWSALRASWLCEIENLLMKALQFRMCAFGYFHKVHEKGALFTQGLVEDHLILVDISRRLGAFTQALDRIGFLQHRAPVELPNPPAGLPRSWEVRSRYEQYLCEAQDRAAHTIQEAFDYYTSLPLKDS